MNDIALIHYLVILCASFRCRIITSGTFHIAKEIIMFSRSDHYLFSETWCSLLCSFFFLSDFQGLLHLSLCINEYPYHKFFLFLLTLSLPVSKLQDMCSLIYFCIHYPSACGSTFCFMLL